MLMPGMESSVSGQNLIAEQSKDMVEPKIPSICVDDLPGRVCYFSLSGDLALKAYEEIQLSSIRSLSRRKARLKEDVSKRLFFSVAMFDHVVMHCSDPLRSREILDILEKNKQWIVDGRIVFLFSNRIRDIREDYRNYIQEKKNEYKIEGNAEKEAESLSQEFMTDDYYQRVIEILSASKYMVRKPTDIRYSFPQLVKSDLKKTPENIVVDSESTLTELIPFKLSLYQLLHTRQLDEAGKHGDYVFPLDIVEGVIDSINDCLTQKTPIARSAIVDMLQKELEKPPTKAKKKTNITRLQKTLLKAITLRMDILYCQMNCGKQLNLEFHPLYGYSSVYQHELFEKYLSMTRPDIGSTLSYATVNQILGEEDLPHFRLGYLACMADTIEHMNITVSVGNFGDPSLLLKSFLSEAVKQNGIEKNE